MKKVLFSAVLLVLLAMALAVPAGAFPQEYTVEPAFGAIGVEGADVAPITFWDLTLREMVIIGALAISPAFVFPVEIFFALKLLSCFGFRRIARNNILASSVRNTIFTLIRSSPGISFAGLQQETGISRGALTYHLTLMRIAGKIVILGDHGSSSYFENSGAYDRSEQTVLKYLRQETDRQILVTLSAHPLMSRRDFEERLGLSGPTVTWHMKRLIGDGLLSIRRDGRFSRYVLSETARACLGKYRVDAADLPDSPAGQGTPSRYFGGVEAAEL